MKSKYYKLTCFAFHSLIIIIFASCESKFQKEQMKAHEKSVAAYKQLFNYNIDSVFRIVDVNINILSDSLIETPITGKVIVFTKELDKFEAYCPLAYRAPKEYMAYDIKDLENVIIQEFYQETNDDYLKITCINLASKKVIKRVIVKGYPVVYENKNHTVQYSYGRIDVQQVESEMSNLF